MIQRVQTIFLFLVAVAMLLVTYFTIWEQVNPDQTEKMKLTAWNLTTYEIENGEEGGVINQTGTYYIGILAIIAAVLALYSLSKFKNRTRQMFLNMINSLVMGSTLGLVVYQSYQANLDFNPSVSGAYVIGFYAIVAAILLNVISNRFIRRDEMLVKSVDRIR
ncbi:MAG: DUF4293 domain-containing protein [Anditalea sp.]